jgi:hypothetical protein
MIALGLPGEFAAKASALGWGDVLWALGYGVLSPKAAVRLAEIRAEGGDERPDLLTLAGFTTHDTEAIRDAVARLAGGEVGQHDDAEARRAWLFITLAWVRSRPEVFPDPLATAELLYADFGYPEAVKGFIRYMPRAPELDGETTDAAIFRMLQAWDAFLGREGVTVGWGP